MYTQLTKYLLRESESRQYENVDREHMYDLSTYRIQSIRNVIKEVIYVQKIM